MERLRTWGPFGAVVALGLMLFTVPLRAEQPSTYQVGPGDVLQIAFYAGGEKQEDFSGTVSSLGTVTCPLLGELKVAGMTTYEISKAMTEKLSHDFFVDPQVLVSVHDYGGQVWVVGAVKSPGPYAFSEGLTALKACLLAGGFTDFASLKKVKVTRTVNGHPKAVSVDLTRVMQGKADDPPLLRSDRIEVPQRRF